MEILFENITEKEYNNTQSIIIFENKEIDRSYGLIYNNLKKYKLAWQSTLINPVLLVDNENILLLGIDQKFIILNILNDDIMLNLDLEYFFYDIKKYNEKFYIITELEIILINSNNYKILNNYILPDYFEDIIFEDKNNILVKCINGEFIYLK